MQQYSRRDWLYKHRTQIAIVCGVAVAAFYIGWLAASNSTANRDSPPVPITLRDGYPTTRVIIRQKNFRDNPWPYVVDSIVLEGDLRGGCYIEVAGKTYGLNATAINAGYAPTNAIRKPAAGQTGANPLLADESGIQGMALQMVAQLRTQWHGKLPQTDSDMLDR